MTEIENEKFEEWIKPAYRYQLRALIISKGFRTTKLFAESMDVSFTHLAKVITGYEIPGPTLAKKMVDKLGIDLKTLADLIKNEQGTQIH
jgi:hypothetical protein